MACECLGSGRPLEGRWEALSPSNFLKGSACCGGPWEAPHAVPFLLFLVKGLGCRYSPYKGTSTGPMANGVQYRASRGCYGARGCAEADPGMSAPTIVAARPKP